MDFNSNTKTKGTAFGYKCAWFAIKSNDIEEVWNELKPDFDLISFSNFENGVKHGYGGRFTLTKAINNWCLLISTDAERYLEKMKHKNFEEVHLYATHRVSDYIHIVKIENKTVVRDLSVSDGEVNKSEGTPTDIEKIWAEKRRSDNLEGEHDEDVIKLNSERTFEEFFGDEEGIMEIAGNWSINPQDLKDLIVDDFSLQLDLKNKPSLKF